MKWTIELTGKEEDCVKHINALLETFKLAVKVDEPVHHAFFSDTKSSLNCKRDK